MNGKINVQAMPTPELWFGTVAPVTPSVQSNVVTDDGDQLVTDDQNPVTTDR